MAGNIGLQILRGSKDFDLSTSDKILKDGQLFYSKKNKQLYIGDDTREEVTPIGAANLVPSEGRQSTRTQTEYETFDFDPKNSNTNTISLLESNDFKIVKNESNEILSNVYGSYSQSLGYANQVNRGSSLAVGYRNLITGNVDAPGNYGYAFGNANFVSGVASSSFGLHNCIDAEASFTFGQLNSILTSATPGEGRHIAVGNNHIIRSGENNAAFGNKNDISGKYNAAFGQDNIIDNSLNTAIGSSNILSGTNNTAIGSSNTLSNKYNTVFGYKNTNAGQYVTISGQSNECWGNDSFIVGNNNTVSGSLSFTSGKSNKSDREGAVTLGHSNTNEQQYTAVFGNSNYAHAPGATTNYSYSLINGYGNESSNSYQMIHGWKHKSTAPFTFTGGGDNSKTDGYNENNAPGSIVYGSGLYANRWRQAIFGQFNNKSSTAHLQFGFGASNSERKNILDLFSDGTLSVRSLELTTTHKNAKIPNNPHMLYVEGSGQINGELKVLSAPTSDESVVRIFELNSEIEDRKNANIGLNNSIATERELRAYGDSTIKQTNIYNDNENKIYLDLNHSSSKEFISTAGGQTIQGSLTCNELSTTTLKINGSTLTFTSLEGLY